MTVKTHKPKVKRQANPHIGKNNQPNFIGWETWTGAEYHSRVRAARRYYYEGFKDSDLVKYVWTWMSQNGYTAEQICKAQFAPGGSSPTAVIGVNCKLLLDGMPDYNPAHAEYWNSLQGTSAELKPISESIRKIVDEAVETGVIPEPVTEKTVTDTRTIQDRITDTVRTAAGEVEEWLSEFKDRKWDPAQFDFRSYFERHKFSPVHAKRLASFYQDDLRDLSELAKPLTKRQMEALDQSQREQHEQIREGYSNLTRAQIQRYHSALNLVVQECDAFANMQRAVKTTKRITPQRIDAQVAKLKFLANDTVNGLTSINPQSIIGAERLWIYNTKTRKLGCYVAERIDPTGANRPGSGLGVKGTTITGFDTDASIQKTVRKPADTLREFNAANKRQLAKFMDTLTTMDSKMNGRINSDTILLRVG